MFNNVTFSGFVFVASDHAVWKLDARRLAKGNVKLLTDEKHFELAVSLAEQTPQFDQKEMITLKRKLATNLFLQREFEKCFSIHLEINTGINSNWLVFKCGRFRRLARYESNTEVDSQKVPSSFVQISACRIGRV